MDLGDGRTANGNHCPHAIDTNHTPGIRQRVGHWPLAGRLLLIQCKCNSMLARADEKQNQSNEEHTHTVTHSN